MKNKLFPALFFFLIVLFFPRAAVPVAAQEGGPSVFRLSWQPVDYVSHYELTVEVRTRTNTWIEALKKTTEAETFAECPLFVGAYRFRVAVYDLLGNPAAVTDWVNFEVKASQKESVPGTVEPPSPPEESKRPVVQLFLGTMEKPKPAAEIAEKTQQTTAETREAAEETYRKVEEISESMQKIQREMEQMKTPAGETPLRERSEAPEELPERTGFGLEILAQPFIILPFSDFNEIFATSPIQPLGLGLRLSVLPFVTWFGVFGLEINPSWNFLANDILITSRYTHIGSVCLSLVWQIQPFSRSTGINVRIGGGAAYIKSRFNFNDGREVAYLNAWNPLVSGGVSFFIRLNRTIFVNAGIDYLHFLARDNITLNYLRPSLSLGFWF